MLSIPIDFQLVFLQACFCGLDVALRGFSFHHEIQDLVLDLANTILSVFDFMLERAILFVRLHRHHLIAVFRNLAFNRADFALEFLPIGLIVLRLFFRVLESRLRRLQLLV